MMKRLIVLSIILLIGMTSCKNNYQLVVFKSIENIQLSKVENGVVNMSAEVILNNPNSVKVKLRSIDIDLFLQDKKVAIIQEKYSLKIEPLSDFSLPVDIGFNISELGLLESILGFFQRKEFEVHYVGKGKVTVRGFPVHIPIDYYHTLKFK